MIETSYLRHQFLIAMPSLVDSHFHHTVTYLCEHNDDGAMGLVINRPLGLSLSDLLDHLAIPNRSEQTAQIPLYAGGPVERERGFVIHRPLGNWDATLPIQDDIGVTTSKDILQAIACDQGPEQKLITLGYAGWGSGQLEREMAENAWLSGPMTPEILFDMAYRDRWTAAAKLIGVDLRLLSSDAGHA